MRTGRGQYVKSGQARGHGANVIYTWPPDDVEQVDVVGQSEYGVEVTDAADPGGRLVSVNQYARDRGGPQTTRGGRGSQRRRLASDVLRQSYSVQGGSENVAGSAVGPRRTRGRGTSQTTRGGGPQRRRLGLKQSVYGSEEHLGGSFARRTRDRGTPQTTWGRTPHRRLMVQ